MSRDIRHPDPALPTVLEAALGAMAVANLRRRELGTVLQRGGSGRSGDRAVHGARARPKRRPGQAPGPNDVHTDRPPRRAGIAWPAPRAVLQELHDALGSLVTLPVWYQVGRCSCRHWRARVDVTLSMAACLLSSGVEHVLPHSEHAQVESLHRARIGPCEVQCVRGRELAAIQHV
jgi:hypothetical protein